MNTFYVRLLITFLVANFIVLGISIFGTRALIDSQTKLERDVDLVALHALVQQTYVAEGREGIRLLNEEYIERGKVFFVFFDGQPSSSIMSKPVRDFYHQLSFTSRSTVALPREGAFLHSLPLAAEIAPPKTAVVIHQKSLPSDLRNTGRADGGPRGLGPGGREGRGGRDGGPRDRQGRGGPDGGGPRDREGRSDPGGGFGEIADRRGLNDGPGEFDYRDDNGGGQTGRPQDNRRAPGEFEPPPGDFDPRLDGPNRPPGGRGSPGAPPGVNDPLTSTSRTTLLVYLSLLVIGIALAGWIVARNLTAPLRSVQNTIKRFAHGDLSARVGTHLAARGDDMGRLAEDFDHMAAGVEEMIRGRDRLLHHLSHEMRSPLARLRFAIELARGEDKRGDLNLERADKEIDRLDKLMGDMLQMARSETEMVSPARSEVNLSELIDLCVDRIAIDAECAQVNVTVESADNLRVHAQRELLDSAIENVIRNAIKYSPENGLVTVCTRVHDDVVTIEILDQGPGVPVGEHAALFEPFYRASNSLPGEGYGLGLAIVAKAMRAHSGRVEVENGKNGGLLVRLKLPLDEQ